MRIHHQSMMCMICDSQKHSLHAVSVSPVSVYVSVSISNSVIVSTITQHTEPPYQRHWWRASDLGSPWPSTHWSPSMVHWKWTVRWRSTWPRAPLGTEAVVVPQWCRSQSEPKKYKQISWRAHLVHSRHALHNIYKLHDLCKITRRWSSAVHPI